MLMPLWMYRGAQFVLVGLMMHLIARMYDRYLQVNKCPFCKAEVPDGADLCPSCYRSLLGYHGIDVMAVISTAVLLFLCLVVAIFTLIPHSWSV